MIHGNPLIEGTLRPASSLLGPNVKDLHAKIGQLSMENDFLSNAFGRIGPEGASVQQPMVLM